MENNIPVFKDNRGNSALDHAKTQGLNAFIDLLE